MSSGNDLPPFEVNGYLPSGDYWPTETAFERRFVSVATSTTRADIYTGFKQHRLALLQEGVNGDSPCLLNGSYTTVKLEPGDVDLVVEVDLDKYQRSPRLQSLLAGKKTRETFRCDAYPILVVPETHPWFEKVTKQAREYWLRWFGEDREGVPKGRVWSSVEGFR